MTDQTKTTPMAPPLPHVVWRCIASHLSDDLRTLLTVAAFSMDLREICRPHISSFFQTVIRPMPLFPRRFFYHRLVQLILEGYLDPATIYEFYSWADYEHQPGTAPRRFFCDTIHDRAALSEQDFAEFDSLLKNAVHASPYISSDQETDICARFYAGDPDAALAILLPCCAKLKMLEIPIDSPICGGMVQVIAQEYQRREISSIDARNHAWEAALNDRRPGNVRKVPHKDVLPFSELLILVVTDFRLTGHSFALVQMVPFMGLPSLHRIVLGALRDRDFPGWPAGHLECRCPEIYFQQSSVTKRAVIAFAQGISGPCEIRQWYERRPDYADHVERNGVMWDTVSVQRDPDGSKSIETNLQFEGGNPGYDYDWVSWLWHGKMKDWKRIDEVFSLQDGDEDEEWLMGMLV